MSTRDENVALTEKLWHTLYVDRDLDAVGAMFTDDGHYEDVPVDDGGATGPAQIAARLRIGFEPVRQFDHEVYRVVAEGDLVITEHCETWHFDDEVSVALPFVSVQEIHDGRFTLWRDYSNINTLLDNAPAWWIEHIMSQPSISDL